MEREHFKDYLDLLTGFEASKRTFTADNEISITVPNQTLDLLCKRYFQKDFSTVLESTYPKNLISIRFNKMRIDKELSKSIFDKAINRILELLQELFAHFDFQTAELIFLVGGFSECKLVQVAIKDSFPKKTILVSEQTDFATLKGAVLYGHNNEKCADEDIIDNFDKTKRPSPPLFTEDSEELPTHISFLPINEDIIDNFDYTKRSPPPLFTEDPEGVLSPGISKTAKETCETVLAGFKMTTTDNILKHGRIDMGCYCYTENAATMKTEIKRNKTHWQNKATPEAFRLSDVKGLLEAIEEKNYTEILKIFYRLQHQYTLNEENKPVEIPVYIYRRQLENTWLREIKNAITSINDVTPGINLYETKDINRSKIHIGVHEDEDPTVACTMYGSIKELPTEYKPFIHLGSKWDVNQMKGTSIHELMHALGFHHEMQRLDREMYLHMDVVKKPDQNYDEIAYKILTRFDPFSVMLYPEDNEMWRKAGDPIWNLKKTQDQCQELSELDKVALNVKFQPCINKSINYLPQLSIHTGMLYCGRQVMLNHNQVGKATTDGFCGPDNWANCASCRVILKIKDKDNQSKDIPKLEECRQKGKWQGLSGLFYCGNTDEKFATDLKHVESDGICGPDTGIPCTECGNELYNGYTIESCDSYFKIKEKRRCVLQ
ncbi:Hypothetical predicted protein [Mytilus galloprovincialis]|uniref:Peptidase metallopeptidase domain-containing protein n=1 Tax=Mytilus galloprovincialis TaxID=29158 RepID=A0A8B6DLJ0_MYTGA|nr:Hypothetical predicted protein [Mytilus galloprovincialis]